MIQEHHARRLHYDFRLGHDQGARQLGGAQNLPDDPTQNRLAIRTEDHPLQYAGFSGDIPKGEYGAVTSRSGTPALSPSRSGATTRSSSCCTAKASTAAMR